VPCSGLGILAKKADMRYKDLSGIEDLANLQYEILNKSKSYLKEGGVLIYSTCTLNPLENEGVIDRFLRENTEYEKLPFKVGSLKSDGALTLYPHVHKTDGFFICKLRRKTNG
jgi:16S rRNA (cytosine967-C5)-methyltransferase